MSDQLVLPHALYQSMLAHARTDAPREVCGLLRGRNGRARDLLPARNAAVDPRHDYLVDAQSLLRALDWEEDGDELIAIYHSHPASPPYPSVVDAANAFYPDSVYLILSLLKADEPELRGFYLRPEAVFQGRKAETLLREMSFRQVRTGLWGFHLLPDVLLPGVEPRAVAADVAFYLVFDENSGRQPPPVRLISVQPVAIIIQL
jgi:proteasome lid subunit RPN8/RPN11